MLMSKEKLMLRYPQLRVPIKQIHMKRFVLLLSFAVFLWMPIFSQKSLSEWEYWIDSGNKVVAPYSDGDVAFAIDASNLSEGLHTLRCRVKDSDGLYSPLYMWTFLCKEKTPELSQKVLSEWEYWIDSGDKVVAPYNNGDIAFVFNATDLSEGLHTLRCRVKDSDGLYSPLYMWTFLCKEKTPELSQKVLSEWEYWIDSGDKVVAPYNNGDIAFVFNATDLSEGLHTLRCRVRDSEGLYSPLYMWTFLHKKKQDNVDRKITWVRYWWNDRTDLSVTESVANDSSVFVYSGKLTVPEYAKVDSINRIARFNIVVEDNTGYFSPVEYADVEYSDDQAPVPVIELVEQTATEVTLKWYIISDEVKDYNIYYSENDGPFILWLPNTTKEGSSFKGQSGKTYRFAVTARDKFGNHEPIDITKCVTVTFSN